MKRIFLILMLAVVATAVSGQIQNKYRLTEDDYNITVEGTSSLHDWEMTATDADGHVVFQINNSAIVGISEINVEVKSGSIISDKNLMEKKAAEALKADEYPLISFSLVDTVSFKNSSDTLKGEVSGTLEIAGIAKPVNIAYELMPLENNEIKVTGSTELLMSDYGIDPPTALLGTIKTDDRVQVSFDTVWIPETTAVSKTSE